MIGVIGARRIVILTALVALNAVLAGVSYGYLMPQVEKQERELRRVKGDVSKKRSDTERLRTEHSQIMEQRNKFENLRATGFMGHQDRFLARDRMEAIQNYSRVLTAKYNIMPVVIEENAQAGMSEQVLLSSKMNVTLDALADVDFYSFIYWLENGFPGQVTINDITLRRQNEVNDVTLRQIGTGTPVVMVRGSLGAEWRTMVPRNEAGLGQAEERF